MPGGIGDAKRRQSIPIINPPLRLECYWPQEHFVACYTAFSIPP
jgi:hypothetical protein